MTPRPLPYPNLILYNGKIRTFATETSTCEALGLCGIENRRHGQLR